MSEEKYKPICEPTDVVMCEAIAPGFDGSEGKEPGCENFALSGALFQNYVPSWVKVISIHEPAVATEKTELKPGKVKQPTKA